MAANDSVITQSGAGEASRTTMADVARLAGVSEKSVSRVVNREAHVSAALKDKVDAAIAQLGYVPDPAARSLAGSRSFTVSLMVDTRGAHYAIKLIDGAYEACKSQGYHLRIENIDSLQSDDALLERLTEVLANSRLDGFILTPPFCDNPAIMQFLETRGIAFTRVAPFCERDRAPCAFIDDAAAAAEIADLLVAKGHRHIGLVTGWMEHGSAIARRDGFLERMADIAPDATIVEASGRFTFERGMLAGRELLDTANRPTAIFAANDDSAAGVMTACAQLGLSIPDEVSICGFDDSWVAKSVWPYLTTVHQPIAEQAREATRMLIDRTGAQAGARQVLLPHRIIERDSILDLT